LADVCRRVEEGSPVGSDGPAPGSFDTSAAAWSNPARTGATLTAMLDRNGVAHQKQLHVRSTIVGAMVYSRAARRRFDHVLITC